jgi:prepilin peptidase CpaA
MIPGASLFYAGAIALIVGAAIQDFRTRTISNGWSVALIALFCGAYLFGAVPGGFAWHGLHFLIALLVGMGLFSLGWIGGGDAKLYAATALWFDIGHGIYLFLCVVIAGAVLAIVHLSVRMLRHSGENTMRSIRKGKIAYGVAIALGAVVAIARTF